jgi:hypothetical protein
MAYQVLGGGIVGELFLCAILIDYYNCKWLTGCWAVEQGVSYFYVLYYIMADG